MKVVVLVLVVIAAIFAVISGVWVATALVSAIFRNRTAQTTYHRPNKETDIPDI